MRRLMLLRHAKSAWDDAGQPDLERPLNLRGRRAAADMAAAMARRGFLPDRILCSSARRTRETLAAFLPFLGDGTRIAITGALYEPPSGEYRTAIAAEGDGNALLLIGHNPVIHRTAIGLAGAGERPLLAELAAKFPTAALAVIDCAIGEWRDLSPGCGRLVAYLTPKRLSATGEAEDAED